MYDSIKGALNKIISSDSGTPKEEVVVDKDPVQPQS